MEWRLICKARSHKHGKTWAKVWGCLMVPLHTHGREWNAKRPGCLSPLVMSISVSFKFFTVRLYRLTVSGFRSGSVMKNMPASTGDTGNMGSIPGSRRSPGGGNGNPLQYSCLENPVDRRTWRGTVHRVTQIESDMTEATEHAHIHRLTFHFLSCFQFERICRLRSIEALIIDKPMFRCRFLEITFFDHYV